MQSFDSVVYAYCAFVYRVASLTPTIHGVALRRLSVITCFIGLASVALEILVLCIKSSNYEGIFITKLRGKDTK